MNDQKRAGNSLIWPACAAVVLIVALSLLVPSKPSKQASPQTKPSARELSSAPIPERNTGLDLTGVVKASDDSPVTNVSIFIYTAQPRTGRGFT